MSLVGTYVAARVAQGSMSMHEGVHAYSISQGLIPETEAILGVLSRKRLIQGVRDFKKLWRGEERKGQENAGSEGMVRKAPPMTPGVSRTKGGDSLEPLLQECYSVCCLPHLVRVSLTGRIQPRTYWKRVLDI